MDSTCCLSVSQAERLSECAELTLFIGRIIGSSGALDLSHSLPTGRSTVDKRKRRASVENLASQVAMMNLRSDPALYEPKPEASLGTLMDQVAMMNLRLDPALYEASLTKLVNQIASIGAGSANPCHCQLSFTDRKKIRDHRASMGTDLILVMDAKEILEVGIPKLL